MKEEDTEELEIGWNDFEEVMKKFGLKKSYVMTFFSTLGKDIKKLCSSFVRK